jgi:hypothetical protein
VLDRDGDVTQRSLSATTKADELRGPRRVVLDDDDGVTGEEAGGLKNRDFKRRLRATRVLLLIDDGLTA